MQVKPQGLGSHQRKHKPGYAGPKEPDRHRKPAPAPEPAQAAEKNGHPSAREKFLCAKCSAPFLTRELRDEHEPPCVPIPTRPPLSPQQQRAPEYGGGFGQ
jgi:hypothetical protein